MKHLELTDDGRVLWKTRDIALTSRQFRVVKLLTRQPGEFVKPEAIYDAFWDRGMKSSKKLENARTLIARLRRAFMDIDPSFDRIETRFTVGYRWRT